MNSGASLKETFLLQHISFAENTPTQFSLLHLSRAQTASVVAWSPTPEWKNSVTPLWQSPFWW